MGQSLQTSAARFKRYPLEGVSSSGLWNGSNSSALPLHGGFIINALMQEDGVRINVLVVDGELEADPAEPLEDVFRDLLEALWLMDQPRNLVCLVMVEGPTIDVVINIGSQLPEHLPDYIEIQIHRVLSLPVFSPSYTAAEGMQRQTGEGRMDDGLLVPSAV